MYKVTRKEFEELRQFQMDKSRGRVLTPDGLRFICEAYGWDALKIGEHMITVLTEMGY